MANTYVDSTATASQTDFAFSFSYLKAEHVKVEINGVDTAAFTLVTSPANKVVLNSGATAGQVVRVRRNSQPDTNLVDFVNGSVLTETELDFAYQHNRFLNEELAELNEASLQIGPGGTDWDAKSNKILNVSTPTLTGDAATKNYVDQKVEQIAAGASTPPSKWQFTGTAGANTTYTVTDADVLGDSAYDVSVNGLVKEPTVDYTVDPDTDTLTIIPSLAGGEDIVIIQRGLGIPLTQGTIGTTQIDDGAVTNAKLANTAVTAAKILDGAVTPSKLDETQAYTVNGLVSNGKVEIGTTTNTNFALNASNAALGSLVIYEPTGSSTEGGQININKAGIATPSASESDSFVIDAYNTGSTGSYGLAGDTDVLRIIGTPGAGEKSIVITEDADVITNGDASITGKVGIGTSASNAHSLNVDGDILVTNAGNVSMELGGGTGFTAFIDLKNPSTDDYDVRVISDDSTTIDVVHNSRARVEGHNSLGLCAGDTSGGTPIPEVVTVRPDYILIKDTTGAPSGDPTGGGYLYVESGALKFKGSSGTVTTIAVA
jgi:hypothetical protein